MKLGLIEKGGLLDRASPWVAAVILIGAFWILTYAALAPLLRVPVLP